MRHQLLVYAGDVNLLGNNINTIMNNTKYLIDTREESDLEGSREKRKYMSISLYQISGLSHNKIQLTSPFKILQSSNIWE
jgi:hypothetical protein